MLNNRKPDGMPSTPLKSEFDRSILASAQDATSSRSYRDHASDADASYSIINEWLTMKGDLESEGDILIKGRVHGNIRCKMLIVDPGGVIEGDIVADEVMIRGTTRGTVRAKRVRLEKTANVDSEIFHDVFSAEEGARIKGALRANDESAERIAQKAIQSAGESPEKKVSSALFQMLDGARAPAQLHIAAAQ